MPSEPVHRRGEKQESAALSVAALSFLIAIIIAVLAIVFA